MKAVFKYIRVSTDEQAEKGFSQRHQNERLDAWCNINGYTVAGTFYEDYSAKNFNRPEWQKLLMILRKMRGKRNCLIIFTKWDRFSRSVADAYQMINILSTLATEAIAIEQPLDMAVPENKMMLSYYLTIPDVENHRRALNVGEGMRRAKKEGRYMGKAPIGYKNYISEEGKKSIRITEDAHLVQWAFETIAEGKYSVQSIFREFKSRRSISKNAFWNMITNILYAGVIVIPASAREAEHLVKAQHEPIITPALFNKVQDVLQGRAKPMAQKTALESRYPYRGLISCPGCGKTLTASSSKGRKKYYTYYHCTSECGQRFRAEEVEELILEELRKLRPHPAVRILMDEVMKDVQGQYKEVYNKELASIRQGLTAAQERKEKSLNLLVAGQIGTDDYITIKNKSEQQILELETKMAALTPGYSKDLVKDVTGGLSVLERLPELFENGDAELRRRIIGSITSEKLDISAQQSRTIFLNEAASLIFNTSAAFSELKKQKIGEKSPMYHEVNLMALFSNPVMFQFRQLAALAA